MKTKRYRLIVTVLALALLMALSCLALVGCNGDTPVDPGVDPVNPGDDPDVPDVPVGPSFAFVENGASAYRIVRSDSSGDDVKELARLLRKGISTSTGVKLDMETDWVDKSNNTSIKEILLGETNRPESKAAMEKLGENQYSISVSGNKIVIVGESSKMLTYAVNEFLRTYAGYTSETEYVSADTLTIPENLNKIYTYAISGNVTLYVTDDTLNYLDRLEAAIKPVVDELKVVSVNDAPLETVFDAEKTGLVIIAGINQMPIGAKTAIYNYLCDGGRILNMGNDYIFKDMMYNHNGAWLSFDDYVVSADPFGALDQEFALDTNKKSALNRFERSAKSLVNKATFDIGDYGLEDTSSQLMVDLDYVDGNDEIRIKVDSVPKNADAICFYAKAGDGDTDILGVSIVDGSGATWVTDVKLSSDWQFYRIPANCFKFYNGQNVNDKYPNIKTVGEISLGFNDDYAMVSDGPHCYCVADVSVCEYGVDTTVEENDDLMISTFCDVTELYPITNGDTVKAFHNQIFVADRDYVLPDSIYSCYPRQESTAYGRERPFRCVPLIEVRDAIGLRSGYAAWMMIFNSKTRQYGAMEGSIIATFSGSEDFYDESGIAAVVDTVKAMTRDRFLIEGGTQEYTYVTGDTTEIIAGVAHATLRTNDTTGLETRVTLYQNGKVLAMYTSKDRVLVNRKNNIYSFEDKYSLSNGRPDHVVASLYQDGVEIDRIVHDIHYWQPKPVEERKFVYTEDGYFKRDGEIIHLFGINVMSSTRAGLTTDGDYSPEILYNDLLRIKDVGFNAVAIWTNNVNNNDMLDLVRMCEELGLYVDMGLSGSIAYPLKPKYDIDRVVECLTKLHFHECDTIISYDIAWEERVGTYESTAYVGRKGWDDEWTQWVKDQYGSIENAEMAWGTRCGRTREGYLYVTDAMMDDGTGTYLKLMSAYYRFIDDIVARLMHDGVAPMKATAPNQMFSFRMSMSGSGYNLWGLYKPSTFCFDFQSLASSMDMMEPEGYTLDKNWEQAVQVPIATAYARYTKPEAPVVWKEFGWGVLEGTYDVPDYNFNPLKWYEENSAACYKETLERMLAAEVDAAFCWWNVAGYRRDERGDCGLWNPDGSDRLYTGLFREYAPKFIGQGEHSEPDVLITVERDGQVGGMNGIYNAVREDVQKAYEQGKTVAFINKLQSEAGEILYADEVYEHSVGDTTKTGTYPLRYVNGMVKDVEIVLRGGKTVALIKVCNTKQSTWRAGTVSLVSTASSDVEVNVIINEEVSYLEDVDVEVPINSLGDMSLRFEIEGVEFGPVYTVTVE